MCHSTIAKRGIFLLAFASTMLVSYGETADTTYLDLPVPATWAVDDITPQGLTMFDVDPDWWSRFDDPTLTALITQGLDHNYDVAMAMRRLEVARLTMESARSGYYPVVGVSAGWDMSRQSGLVDGGSGRAINTTNASLGANLSWEVDLFGRISSQVKEKKAQMRATRAQLEGVRLSVAAEIATQYVQIRTWQVELDIARKHIAQQLKVVNITKAREEVGLGNGLEVAQAMVSYNSTLATIPMLENAITTGINSLAILVGKYPDSILESLKSGHKLPSYNQLVDPCTPLELLRRRPDIVQAAEELSASAAAIGIAKKEFLPKLTIAASVGTQAHNFGDLFKGDAFTYSVAPTLSWTIFDGFSRKYNVEIAKEQLSSQIDNYNLTVMTAVKEIENAMSSYQASLRHAKAVNDVQVQANKTLEYSLDRYKRGLSPFSDVVTAQMNCLEYQDQEVQVQGKALTYLITLYKALGGGWQ